MCFFLQQPLDVIHFSIIIIFECWFVNKLSFVVCVCHSIFDQIRSTYFLADLGREIAGSASSAVAQGESQSFAKSRVVVNSIFSSKQ